MRPGACAVPPSMSGKRIDEELMPQTAKSLLVLQSAASKKT